MKKTFPLKAEGKNPERMLEATKHEIRKYIKRERRRDLPEGVDFWDFDCKFGLSTETAETVHLSAVIPSIDAAAKEQAVQVYVEIITTHGKRTPKPVVEEVLLVDEEDGLPE